MKIGIITYHRSVNYGAQLQAYALRKALQNLGHESEVIDCNSIGSGKIFHWSFSSLKAFAGSLRNNILCLISENKRHRLFREFSQKMIGLSLPCNNKEDLARLVSRYDYVITGSDQVWHPQICEGQTCFFLDLPIKNEQKIAYAPSFGVIDYTQTEVGKYMPLIKQIKHLSVREEAGQAIIKKYTGKDIPLVVDPTMLLSPIEWQNIAKKSRYSKYLFYFTILDEPEGTDDLVRKIAKEKGLSIVRIGTVKDILKTGFTNARANGPQDFLGIVRDAEFIVTSSFHGTVFSILFEKQFVCVLNNNERNSRMQNLADKLSLSDYVISDIKRYNFIENYKEIDYTPVNHKLQKLRSESMDFLKKATGL